MSRHRGALLVVALALAVTGSWLTVPGGRVRANVGAYLTKHVGAPAAASPAAPFDTATPPVLRLAVAGDVGTGGRAERATAAAVATAGADRRFDGFVLLGDNVYPGGDPARLQATVFGPFGPVLNGGASLLAVLGNHDVEAQLGPLAMPGRWYARSLGPVLFIGLDSNRPDDPAQRGWLEQTLAGATEPWKIVALHHPPYSAGWHGSSLNVRDAFAPLFERYGVQLVLAGHDHDYQRSTPIRGVTYVVSGGAAKLRKTGRADYTATSWSTYHFVDMAVWADHLQLRAIGQDGRVFDTATIAP